MDKHVNYLIKLYNNHKNNIICLDIYVKSDTKIEHHCNVCNRSWFIQPTELARKRFTGCRMCAEDEVNRNRRTPEQYQKEISEIHNGKIIAITPYVSRNKKVTHLCTNCNKTWNTKPIIILYGGGCVHCVNIQRRINLRKYKPRKTNEQYIKDLYAIHFDSIIPLEKYTTYTTPTKHQCMICDHIWNPTPDTLLDKRGCPRCCQSSGEKYVGNLLKSWNINYTTEKTFNGLILKSKLFYDFYLPEHNILIEYDGEQHFRPIKFFGGDESFKKTQKRDSVKNKYAEKHGITLIRIPYTYEFKDIKNELKKLFKY